MSDIEQFVIEDFSSLSRKARHILSIIVYYPGEITREQLARQLGQPTLYGYDLRILATLQDKLFIASECMTMYNFKLDNSPGFRDYVSNWNIPGAGSSYKRIRWGNSGKIYIYWCNDAFKPILKRILKEAS